MAPDAVSFETLVLRRLDLLEKENRRFRWLVFGLLVVCAGLVTFVAFIFLPVGGGLKNILRLHIGAVTLMDNRGRERLELQPGQGHPSVAIYDEKGGLRVLLAENAGGASLLLTSGPETPWTATGLWTREGQAGAFLDIPGKNRLEIKSNDSGTILDLSDVPSKIIKK